MIEYEKKRKAFGSFVLITSAESDEIQGSRIVLAFAIVAALVGALAVALLLAPEASLSIFDVGQSDRPAVRVSGITSHFR